MNLNFNPGGNRPRYKFRDYLKAEKIGWIVTLVIGIALIITFTVISYVMGSKIDEDLSNIDGGLNISSVPEPPETPENQVSVLEEEPSSATEAQPDPNEPEVSGEDAEAALAAAAPETWLPPALGTWERAYGFSLDPTHDDYRLHSGMDMPLPLGDLVFAVAAGTVSKSANDDRWGGRVEITHGGGYTSVYLGIVPSVKEGQTIQGGDTIATIAPSPPAEKAQDTHLHFELWSEEELVDPATYLK